MTDESPFASFVPSTEAPAEPKPGKKKGKDKKTKPRPRDAARRSIPRRSSRSLRPYLTFLAIANDDWFLARGSRVNLDLVIAGELDVAAQALACDAIDLHRHVVAHDLAALRAFVGEDVFNHFANPVLQLRP